MQDADLVQPGSSGQPAWQWVICVLTYGYLWACAFNLLWFLESRGPDYFHHRADVWQVLLPLAWNILCPDWPLFAVGAALGLLTCVSLPKFGSLVRSSLCWSLLPAAAILAMFNFTTSGLLPSLMAMSASGLAAAVVARTWQEPLFAVPVSGRSLAPKRVPTVLVWLLALSIPFRLFELLIAVFGLGLPAEITEAKPIASPDGAYIAVIHNVDPNINAFTDVVIRPRHTIFGLLCTNSASSRIAGIDHIQWTGRRTLCIWRSYDAGEEQWHDVRIVYKDTRGPEEKKEDDAFKE